jgi:putative sterol carrier protein
MSEVEDTFRELIDQFHDKINSDAEAKEKLLGKEVRMNADIQGDAIYHFHLKDGEIVDFGLGAYDEKDCTVTMSLETFNKLRAEELSPMKAFMTKKITFEGSMSDLLMMRGVLTGD